MARVSRKSFRQKMAEQKALFSMLLLAKKTKNSSATSSLPNSRLPFDQSTPAKAGAKGPKQDRGDSVNVRVEVVERSSKVSECGRCGEGPSEVANADQAGRVRVDIEFVTTETRIDAQLKRGANCKKINRGKFPDNMPGALQYGHGVVAFATDLVISQMVPPKRTAQLLLPPNDANSRIP